MAPPPTERSGVVGRGRGWGVRCRTIKRRLNYAQHAFDIGQNIIVPEAQNSVTARIEKVGSQPIGVCLLIQSMLPAIQFDDEAKLMASEVRVVRPNRCLAPEMRSLGGNAPQMPPQLPLRDRHVATKFTSPWHACVGFARFAFCYQISRPPPPTSPRRHSASPDARKRAYGGGSRKALRPSHQKQVRQWQPYPATLPIERTASSDRLPSSSQNFVKSAAFR